MIDLKWLKEHPAEVKQMLALRGVVVDIERLIALDNERLKVLQEIEAIRAQRNVLTQNDRAQGVALRAQLKELEPKLKALSQEVLALHESIPNLLHPDVPEGTSEADNTLVRNWFPTGETPQTLSFKAKSHEELMTNLGWLDLERGAKVSGSGFFYLTREAVWLELALIQYVLKLSQAKGFIPVITPELVRQDYIEGTGYLPKREEPDIYKLDNEDLYLIATAEIPLAAMHAGELLSQEELPLKYIGFSSCFRKESGTYGKYRRGIFRMHQFDKLEMFVFTTPDQSMLAFKEIIELAEEIVQGLKIPYQVVNICAGEMNGPGHLKYDLNYYSPVDNTYRELGSGTNTTDYQARRLNIKYRTAPGTTEYVHTLNNTAAAMSRLPIAIIENYQQADGSVLIPEVLQEYIGYEVITGKK